MKIQTPSLSIDYLQGRFVRLAVAVLAALALTVGLQVATASSVFAHEEETTTSEMTAGEETAGEGESGAAGTTTNSDNIKSGVCSGVNVSLENSDCEDNDADEQVSNTLGTVLNLFSVAAGIASVIMMIYAGFRYIVSGGDEKGIVSAKKTMIYAIVGVVLVLLAQSIVQFVLNRLV